MRMVVVVPVRMIMRVVVRMIMRVIKTTGSTISSGINQCNGLGFR